MQARERFNRIMKFDPGIELCIGNSDIGRRRSEGGIKKGYLKFMVFLTITLMIRRSLAKEFHHRN